MQGLSMSLVERLSRYEPVERILGAVKDQPGAMLLDSGSHDFGMGHFSILMTQPVKELVYRNGMLESRAGDKVETQRGDPFALLRSELSWGKRPASPSVNVPFTGGAVGYFSYDLGRRLKPSTLESGTERKSPDYRFGIYDSALVWDHSEQALYAVVDSSAANPERSLSRQMALAESAASPYRPSRFEVGVLKSNFAREEYLKRIVELKEWIREGEIYQANFSQRFTADFDGSGIDLYHQLRTVNPAPYAAYLNFGDEEILSSSPERFLKCADGFASTRPIKGTRPRGCSQDEEDRFRHELSHSEKDWAELLMIVDLERNDLGRVCVPGTIEVKDLYGLETYASVIHQTATVQGRLRPECDAIDAIEAMFPGGSITGAPKIRAMEIIDETERGDRGVYTGSIGYLGFDGRADFNIAIRTICVEAGQAVLNVGGGIVWDSDPDSEYEETLLKARALFTALGKESDHA